MASQLLTRAELEVLVKKNDSSIKMKKVKANEEHEYYCSSDDYESEKEN